MNKSLLLLLAVTACAETPIDSTTADPDLAGEDGKADGATCTSEVDASALFDIWAKHQGVGQQMDRSNYLMRAVVDTDPPTYSVTRSDRPYIGSDETEWQFLLTLDENGREVARAPGRYIDRIGPGKYLLDKAYEYLTYGFSDPLFYKATMLYASDNEGNTLWQVDSHGAAGLTQVFRMDDHHWLLIEGHHNVNAQVKYFDDNGTMSVPPTAEHRPCATQGIHSVCNAARLHSCEG